MNIQKKEDAICNFDLLNEKDLDFDSTFISSKNGNSNCLPINMGNIQKKEEPICDFDFMDNFDIPKVNSFKTITTATNLSSNYVPVSETPYIISDFIPYNTKDSNITKKSLGVTTNNSTYIDIKNSPNSTYAKNEHSPNFDLAKSDKKEKIDTTDEEDCNTTKLEFDNLDKLLKETVSCFKKTYDIKTGKKLIRKNKIKEILSKKEKKALIELLGDKFPKDVQIKLQKTAEKNLEIMNAVGYFSMRLVQFCVNPIKYFCEEF